MDDSLRTLGERIIDAARLAAAVHLHQLQRSSLRQDLLCGGAGSRLLKDESATREGSLPRQVDRRAG
jgi:hypothetical protein